MGEVMLIKQMGLFTIPQMNQTTRIIIILIIQTPAATSRVLQAGILLIGHVHLMSGIMLLMEPGKQILLLMIAMVL